MRAIYLTLFLSEYPAPLKNLVIIAMFLVFVVVIYYFVYLILLIEVCHIIEARLLYIVGSHVPEVVEAGFLVVLVWINLLKPLILLTILNEINKQTSVCFLACVGICACKYRHYSDGRNYQQMVDVLLHNLICFLIP